MAGPVGGVGLPAAAGGGARRGGGACVRGGPAELSRLVRIGDRPVAVDGRVVAAEPGEHGAVTAHAAGDGARYGPGGAARRFEPEAGLSDPGRAGTVTAPGRWRWTGGCQCDLNPARRSRCRPGAWDRDPGAAWAAAA
jgi:hypothetical protein